MSHCWEDGPRKGETATEIGVGSSCMLDDGHVGPHEFTWDDEIVISFAQPHDYDVTRPLGSRSS